MAKSFFLAVEHHRQVIRLFVLHHLLQHFDESVLCIGGQALGIGEKLPDAEEGPEYIGRPVDEVERLIFIHSCLGGNP